MTRNLDRYYLSLRSVVVHSIIPPLNEKATLNLWQVHFEQTQWSSHGFPCSSQSVSIKELPAICLHFAKHFLRRTIYTIETNSLCVLNTLSLSKMDHTLSRTVSVANLCSLEEYKVFLTAMFDLCDDRSLTTDYKNRLVLL